MSGLPATRANGDGSVTELDASDGSRIRTLSGRRYGVRYPSAIAADSAHSWVANDPQTGNGRTSKPGDGSVTELNATDGSFVQILSGGRYRFSNPSAITVIGGHLWVASGRENDNFGGVVSELDASDGSWIRALSAARCGFNPENSCGLGPSGAALWRRVLLTWRIGV